MGESPMEPLISLKGVTKRYGEGTAAFQALKGIDLDIMAGEFVAVMGPSGSGKSTTMNILGCLDVPTTGTFLFKGVDVGSAEPRPARAAAPALSRLRLPGLQSAGAHHGAGECRAAADLSRRSERTSATTWPWRRSTRWAWPTASRPHRRPNSPAASSSASPSPARSSPIRTCCSPTSRPAISTAQRSIEIMELLTDAQPDERHHHR